MLNNDQAKIKETSFEMQKGKLLCTNFYKYLKMKRELKANYIE